MALPFTRQDRVRLVVRTCPRGKVWGSVPRKVRESWGRGPTRVLAEDNHVLIVFSTREADVQEVKGVVRTMRLEHMGSIWA